jgi:peptidoglycan/LPS O-acetylase OafA/YrhL
METTGKRDSVGGRKRIPELDGLRGLAIFLVILCHYVGEPPHGISHSWQSRIGSILDQGATGVDLFFVLSGFLIGGILMSTRESPQYYNTFYLRRFHRIIPLYYSWLVFYGALWVISSKWGGPGSVSFRPATPYWVFFLFLQNYFLRPNQIQAFWLVSLWSLAVEEQFYLVAPPLVRKLTNRRLTMVMIAVVAFALLLRSVLCLVYGARGAVFAYFWTPCRADDIALGVLLAIGWATPQAKLWAEKHLIFLYSMLGTCAAVLIINEYWMARPFSYVSATYCRTFFGLFFAFLVAVLLIDPGSVLGKFFRLRPLRELGKISYCVYIIHQGFEWGVFRILRHDVPRFDSWPSIGITMLALAVTIGVAELSWHFFEHPLIRRGHRYRY